MDAAQRRAQRVADERRPVRRADRRVRRRDRSLAGRPGGRRVLAAGGRQLPRALRPAAPDARGRPLRAHPSGALVELQQRGVQRAALPPAAPQRPPRQPDAPLPGPAALRRGAAAADRLRGDDRARLDPAALAARDGRAAARPLRRRRRAREHPPPRAREGGSPPRPGGRGVSRPPYAVAARELLRETVLDATDALLRERPWAEVTLAEVAKEAGISRQTIYNEFGSRIALAQAYVLREGDRFLTGVQAAIEAHPGDPPGALAAAFSEFLHAAHEHPLLRAIVAGDGGDELLGLVTSHDSPVIAFAAERLAGFLTDGWPALR